MHKKHFDRLLNDNEQLKIENKLLNEKIQFLTVPDEKALREELGCPMEVSDNPQSCALGAAMAGAVVGGGFPTFGKATEAMTCVSDIVYEPIPENQAVYARAKKSGFLGGKIQYVCRVSH